MGSVVIALIPLIIGSAVVPVQIIVDILLLIPILIRIIMPEQSKSVLDGASAWLTKHNRPIVIAV